MITIIKSTIKLEIKCGVNNKRETQPPEYVIYENNQLVESTTDTIRALQCLINRIQ